MSPRNRIPYKSLSDLKLTANEIITNHLPNYEIPIDIETIVESPDKFGLKIIATPNLKKRLEHDSYICIPTKTIIIDSDMYDILVRSRFSYAHELSHYVLHKDIDGFDTINSEKEYLDFQKSLNKNERGRIEFQAYRMAGYLLLPPTEFRELVDKRIEGLGGEGDILSSDLELIFKDIPEVFNVSKECVSF